MLRRKRGQEIWVSCRRQNLNFRFCFKPLLGYSLLMCFCYVMLCFKCLPWGRPPIWEAHKAVFHPGIPFTSVVATGCNITHTTFSDELLSLIIWAKGRWVQNEAMIFQDTWEIAVPSVLQVPLYLRPQKLAWAIATSESALAFDLGKSSKLVPFRAVTEIHLKIWLKIKACLHI